VAFVVIVSSVLTNLLAPELLSNSAVTVVCNTFFLGYTAALLCAGVPYAHRLTSKLHTHEMNMASKRSNSGSGFRRQITKIRRIISVCLICGFWFVGTNLWYFTTLLNAGEYVTHAYLQHFAEVALAFLALFAVHDARKMPLSSRSQATTTQFRAKALSVAWAVNSAPQVEMTAVQENPIAACKVTAQEDKAAVQISRPDRGLSMI
jgi:hypothetical protein